MREHCCPAVSPTVHGLHAMDIDSWRDVKSVNSFGGPRVGVCAREQTHSGPALLPTTPLHCARVRVIRGECVSHGVCLKLFTLFTEEREPNRHRLLLREGRCQQSVTTVHALPVDALCMPPHPPMGPSSEGWDTECSSLKAAPVAGWAIC